jgi:hypothetical protein
LGSIERATRQAIKPRLEAAPFFERGLDFKKTRLPKIYLVAF